MRNQNSARKSLLSSNRKRVTSEFQQSVEPRQERYMTVRQIYQARINQQQKLRERCARLKDKSLIVAEPPLSFHAEWLSKLDKNYQPIYPQSRILLAWNFFMLIAILFNFFEIPMALFLTSSVYETQTNTAIGLLLDLIFLLGFYADIIIFGFNTAYYQKGKLITKRMIITKKYLQLQFWIDLITTLILTIYLAADSPDLIYIKIFFYFKVYTLFQKDKLILHSLELYRVPFAIYRLFRMIIFLWFITTWTGCIFFAIDYYFYRQQGYYYQTGQLWLLNSAAAGNLNLIQNFQWYVWYEYGLYWALQTSSTIGYGDLTPMNPPQVLYCCFVMLLMTILFAFFINTVWEVISELQLSSIQYSQNWKNIKVFLGREKIPSETKQKISNYLYEVWLDNDNEQIEQIINEKLSKQLKQQFYLQSRSKFFDSFKIFHSLVQPRTRTLGQLAHCLDQIKIGEGENIYQEGDFGHSIYFLRKGKVKLEIEGSSLRQDLKYFESFGSIQFFLRMQRSHTATAIIFSKFWSLSYDNMIKCLKKNAFVYEKFCEITQKIVLTRNISLLGVQCWNCKSSQHFLEECPAVNSWRSIISHQQSEMFVNRPSQRQNFHRKNPHSKKIFSKDPLIYRSLQIQIDNVIHTKCYMPYFNIK